MVIASVGNAAEDPAAAGGPPADLVRAEGTVTVAELGRIDGKALVNKGASHLEGAEGTELKEGHRVMAMEDASARVEYYFGCDYTVKSGESYTVNAEACCLALGLPEEPMMAPPSLNPPWLLPSSFPH